MFFSHFRIYLEGGGEGGAGRLGTFSFDLSLSIWIESESRANRQLIKVWSTSKKGLNEQELQKIPTPSLLTAWHL